MMYAMLQEYKNFLLTTTNWKIPYWIKESCYFFKEEKEIHQLISVWKLQ